jgi:LmbE family N-acetylglucosaminyl deacetylase
VAIILVGIWSVVMVQAATAQASAACPAGATMDIVAHPDDDLLFQSPDLMHDIQSGKCVRTVYLTAGDRGDLTHLQARESGVKDAYAQMAGAANDWTTTDAGIPGHPMPLVTLSGLPTVSLVFVRLPEGFWGGGGTPQDETLQNLWLGNVSQMNTEDGSSAYTKQDLIATLTGLMNAMQPDTIRAQDYLGTFGDGDHDDHHAAAYFARSAHLSYATSHKFIGYMDYASENNPANVFDPDLTVKTNAFYTYLAWDSGPCGAPPECGTGDYTQWLNRQYIVGREPTDPSDPPPNPGPITTVTSPTANQTVSGTIDVAATAQDQSGSGIWLTAFRLDSSSSDAVAVDYASPWGFSLDTTKLTDGQHTLYVRGADHAGNVGPDATVTFTVDNADAPPSSPPPNPGPITSFTSPSANQTVCGSFDVAATAQDQSGTGMWLTAFRLDSPSSDAVAYDYSSPWGFSLNTTTLPDGAHTLYVRGADHAGNTGPDVTVAFNVDNSAAGACATAAPPPNPGPITSIASPVAAQIVSGTIDVTATAQDQSGTGMWLTAFRLDSSTSDAVAVDYSSPWGFSLDTTKLTDGQHTLYVRGADHAGNVGPDATVTFTVDNANAPPPSPPPNPGPITSIASPVAGQTVSGTIDVAAAAQDQSGTGMWLTAFRLDSPDSDAVAVDYSSPWGFSLDTTKLTDGQHTLYVRGADHAGNTGPDATVTFTVDNANAPPPSPPPNPGPITSIATPVAGQTVSGTIDVAATVQDQSGSGVWLTAFRLDDPDSGPLAVDYSSPWGFSLDTTALTNGLHTLFVRAEDKVLNTGPDATVTFYVGNSAGATG